MDVLPSQLRVDRHHLSVGATDAADLIERVDIGPNSPQSSARTADAAFNCALMSSEICARANE